MRGDRFAVIAAICLCASVAVACTGSDVDPSQTRTFTTASLPTYSIASDPPTTSTSTPPSPSIATTGPNVEPGEKPPVLEAAAKHNNALGALAYTRYWIATIDWAYATLDTSLARTQYAASCTGCERFMNNIIDKTREHGDTLDGGRLVVTESHLLPTDHHAHATQIVDEKIAQGRLLKRDATGKVVDSAKAAVLPFRTWLRWTDAHWQVVDWKLEVVK